MLKQLAFQCENFYILKLFPVPVLIPLKGHSNYWWHADLLLECLLPPAKEVWVKVIFLHLSVILFFCSQWGGGSTWAGPRTWAGTSPLGRYIPPEQCMLGDTGNKRAVRILLECILVFCYFSVLFTLLRNFYDNFLHYLPGNSFLSLSRMSGTFLTDGNWALLCCSNNSCNKNIFNRTWFERQSKRIRDKCRNIQDAAKAKFPFHFFRCSMWTARWIYQESIWRRCCFRSRFLQCKRA